jgi:PRD1 phage membrane DNA delivery
MSPFFESLTTIALAIVGLATVAVLVSKKAQTPAVIQAGGSAFANSLGIAEAPVTGASYTPVLSYPGTDLSTSFGGGA